MQSVTWVRGKVMSPDAFREQQPRPDQSLSTFRGVPKRPQSLPAHHGELCFDRQPILGMAYVLRLLGGLAMRAESARTPQARNQPISGVGLGFHSSCYERTSRMAIATMRKGTGWPPGSTARHNTPPRGRLSRMLAGMTDVPPGSVVELDLDELETITSEELSQLVTWRLRLAQTDCQLVLSGVREQVREVLALTKLDQLLTVATETEVYSQ